LIEVKMMKIAILLIVTLSACSELRSNVDRDLLAEITIENKLLLFDAENDVAIAIDERERLARDIYQAKLDISDAEAQVDETYDDEERAISKADEAAAGLSEMAREVFHLKIDYLEERLFHLREKLAGQDSLIMVAKAKYELAKAKLVKKNNVRGAQDIELVDFEDQVTEYVEYAKETMTDLSELERQVEAYRQQWLTAREKLMVASGGGVGSPWAEDSAQWGGSW
jgi:chromosome segregation ATPase